MRKVLFVCTGNLCRSPMAEVLLRKSLEERGVDDVVVESAGVVGLPGNPAAIKAISELEKHGMDLSDHAARTLTAQMIKEAELVVVMERAHSYAAINLAPDSIEKIILMGSLLPWLNTDEIADPYGGDDDEFAKSCGVIKEAVELIADKIAKGVKIASRRD